MSNRQEINFMNGVAMALAKHGFKDAPPAPMYHTGKWIHLEQGVEYIVCKISLRGIPWGYQIIVAETPNVWYASSLDYPYNLAASFEQNEIVSLIWASNDGRTREYIGENIPVRNKDRWDEFGMLWHSFGINYDVDEWYFENYYATREAALADFYKVGGGE